MLELVSVLAIIGAIAGIGIGGLTTLRATVELNQVTNEFLTNIRTFQSRARNGLISEARFSVTNSIPQSRVDGFAIYVNAATFNYCTGGPTTGNINYNCVGVEAPLAAITRIPTGISIQMTGSSSCTGILFPRLTGDIAGLTGTNSAPVNTGVCTIVIRSNNVALSRSILVDLENNNIEIL